MQKKRSFGTHDGSFHADEVTACSLLLVFDQIDRDKIVRTRDPEKLSLCEYVCDVGGEYDPARKRFDHHQAEYVGPLSSAGMVLAYLRDRSVLSHHLYDHINRSLVLGVDAHDNGVAKGEPGVCSFSQVISNFLPIEYSVAPQEMDRAFFAAVEFACGHLVRLEKRIVYTHNCAAAVREKMAEGSAALVFDESLPWMENFFDHGGEFHPAQFVIMPSGGHWKLRGIPPNLSERMKVRKPLPQAWAGLHEAELRAATGIAGAIFCHKGRFISIWETKEDAIRALHLALQHTPKK
jgi:uncharacterized UPF0160 family protein